MSKKACYRCRNMVICDLRQKIAETIGYGFSRHIISPTDTDKVKGASVKIYDVIGQACFYFKPFPREKSK
jgi:hypothetical protein